jgi:5-aminopentanamidase
MRLAVLQSPSPMGDIDAACGQAEHALRAAAAMGAAVLVLPEVFLPGYNQPDIPARALTRDSAPLQRLAAAAKANDCALVVGYADAAEGTVWNAAICFDAKGQVAGNYRKVQLYGAREQSLYRPGTAYVTFDLAGQKAAILICYDVEFAPHIKALADDGVRILLVPTANMAPFTHVVRYTVPAMAANHGVAIAYANYCGAEGDLTYVGGSQIVGPHGEVLAMAGEGPALLVADIPDVDAGRISTQSRDLKRL